MVFTEVQQASKCVAGLAVIIKELEHLIVTPATHHGTGTDSPDMIIQVDIPDNSAVRSKFRRHDIGELLGNGNCRTLVIDYGSRQLEIDCKRNVSLSSEVVNQRIEIFLQQSDRTGFAILIQLDRCRNLFAVRHVGRSRSIKGVCRSYRYLEVHSIESSGQCRSFRIQDRSGNNSESLDVDRCGVEYLFNMSLFT